MIIPGATQTHDLAKSMLMGAMIRIEVPNTMTLFRPIRSARMPPGSWKRMWLVFWIVARRPTMVTGALSSCSRYRVHQSSQRPLKML
jgi:hypothetical protein